MLNKILISLYLFFSIGVVFAGDPSLIDLPKDHCRDTWKSIINKGHHKFSNSNVHTFDAQGKNLDYANFLKKLNRHDCAKDWTVLVYMQADNDLRPFAFWDLAEMESAFSKTANASTLKTDVLVHIDTDLDRKLRRYHMFQSKKPMSTTADKSVYEKWDHSNIFSPVVQEFDEDLVSIKKPQAQVFQEFVEWGMANYPSENYMVIIWGHGQGWSQSSAVQFGGIATDDTDNQRISVTEVRQSLEKIRKFSLTGEKVDVLVSDACLMQTIEVTSELGNEARYVIGSTQIQNFMGLPYRRLFYEMNAGDWLGLKRDANFYDDTHRMAALIPRLVAKSFKPRSGGRGFHQGSFDPKAWAFFTMSSVNAEELNQYGFQAFEELSEALIQSFKEDDFIPLDLAPMIETMEMFLGGSRDILSFMAKLEEFYTSGTVMITAKTGRRILKAITGIRQLINNAIIEYFYGDDYWAKNQGYYLGQFKAFGVWLPPGEVLFKSTSPMLKNSYFVQQFSNSQWLTWMEYLYNDELLLLDEELE